MKPQEIYTAPTEYKRSWWKHYVRWIGMLFLIFLYASLVMVSIDVHCQQGKPLNFREIMLWLLVILIGFPLIPSFALEIDKVKVDQEGLWLKNLFFTCKENWDDLISLKNPTYLKFAILKGKRFLYLLNRRDLPDFDKLMETIKHKATNLKQ